MELKALDLTKGGEELSQVSLRDAVWESLDIQVASLLGTLVLDSLTETLGSALLSLKGLLNVELLVNELDSVNLVTSVQGLDSSLGASWSVLTVRLVLSVEADEGIWTSVVLAEVERLNSSVLLEKGAHFSLTPLSWEVLGVDVVEDLSEVTLVSWLVLDGLALISLSKSWEGLGSAGGILEADETISTGGVVRVERNLEGLDISVLAEEGLELRWLHVLWNLAHKDVVVNNLLWVGSQKIIIVWESTTLLAWDELEVTELLAGELELVLLWDSDDG